MMQQQIDGLSFEMTEKYDFGFLQQLGRVFRVFDQQDSGCICFGVKAPEGRRFVKFAGAKTARSKTAPEQAIADLRAAARVYAQLQHENLIHLVSAGELGGGFAAIFEWTDAECMGKQYAAREKFFALPVAQRLEIFDAILDFHLHVARMGYVAVDFYDGSIMYDFDLHRTLICDIDLYRPGAFVNEMGRLWGSGRFMSPEEFELGQTIDEVSNVYLMGATAFNLLGDPLNRLRSTWLANDALFEVATRAVSTQRAQRYPSIADFARAWRAAQEYQLKTGAPLT